jgi:hypothetical protein
MPVVTRVRRVRAPDGRHDHLAGVCTAEGVYFSRHDVASAIDAGDEWWSECDGARVRIHRADSCPSPGCVRPYLTTAPDHTPANDLERLPNC